MSSTLTVPDDPKMLRETLCVAQAAVARATGTGDRDAEHIDRIQRLIDECDQHRPLGSDGKHGSRHTATCGCDDATPGPAAGDVITTAGELDAIRARYVAWHDDTPDEATWPGRDEDESMERYIVRQHVRDLLDAADAPVDAATAGVDREALRVVIDDEVLTRTGRSVGDLASGHVADAVLAFLAAARAGEVTEWGVRYEADRDTVIHEPQESEADARALVEASPTDTALVTRVATPWVEVQR